MNQRMILIAIFSVTWMFGSCAFSDSDAVEYTATSNAADVEFSRPYYQWSGNGTCEFILPSGYSNPVETLEAAKRLCPKRADYTQVEEQYQFRIKAMQRSLEMTRALLAFVVVATAEGCRQDPACHLGSRK